MNYRTRLEAKRDELCDKIIGQRNPEELSAHESNRIEGIYIGFNALIDQTIALAVALDLYENVGLRGLDENYNTISEYQAKDALSKFNKWLGE